MKRKILLAVLVGLLLLPAIGFTGDVEVTSCWLKWTTKGLDKYTWEAEVAVRNYSDTAHRVGGGITFYHPGGHPFKRAFFSGKVEAGERAIFVRRGEVSAHEHEQGDYCEATIRAGSPIRR